MSNYQSTNSTIQYVKHIRENKKYIEIGIKKYKVRFDVSIKNINDILHCNILSTKLEELEKILDILESVDYIDVTEKISILEEELIAIILEEKNPITARLNKQHEEER